MKEKYYNVHEFNQAISLFDINPYEAKLRFEQYLEKYPKDYSAYVHYASILITLNELGDAEKILDLVQKSFNNNSRFYNDPNKRKLLKNKFDFEKTRLLSYKGLYEEAHQLSPYLYSDLKDQISVHRLRFFCEKMCNKLNVNRDTCGSYIYKQIFQYMESDFIEHINKHTANYNQDRDNPNNNIFSPDFPIHKVVNEVKKYIPSERKILSGFIDDVYFFKYDQCGRKNNKIVDYFKVICFHDTANFITMLPVEEGKYLPHVDLNYLKETKENSIVKRKSRVELFNQKYKRN